MIFSEAPFGVRRLGYSDIDVIVKKGGQTFCVQVKVSGSLMSSDIGKFTDFLERQLGSVTADFGPLSATGDMAELTGKKIRFLVPNKAPDLRMPTNSELTTIGDRIIDSLFARSSGSISKAEIVAKLKSGLGLSAGAVSDTLTPTEVRKFFITDAPYSLGIP